MQIFSPTSQRKRALSLVLVCVSLAFFLPRANAQQLAQPGWAGFHTQSEAWWRHAVFYHVEPSMFQDSNGEGRGDLRGLALRLDYLQSLGVDAILLDVPANAAGFDDLLQDASKHRIRVVVEIYADAANVDSIARLWLTRGAAGLYVHTAGVAAPAAMLPPLRALAASFPGQRLLLSDAGTSATAAAPKSTAVPIHLNPSQQHTRSRHSHAASTTTASVTAASTTAPGKESGGLMLAPLTGQFGDTDSTLETSLQAAEAQPNGALPLLSTEDEGRSANRFARFSPDQQRAANAALAAMLLASRGAALLEYGQELGLKLPDDFDGNVPMAWTPANVSATPLEAPPEAKTEAAATSTAAPPKPQQEVYGEYHPYVPPKPKSSPSDPPEPIDPNTLPGFTTGALPPVVAANHSTANVATEESQRDSLLHLYRRLMQLHHENPSLLSGTQQILSTGGQPAIAWLRRAPEGTLTASSVVVACNLSTQPIVLSLGRELLRVGIRSHGLRTLLDSAGSTAPRAADQLTLAPGELYLGEVTR